MQTVPGKRPNRLGRIAAITLVMFPAAAIATLLTWTPSLIGSANDYAAPANLLAVLSPVDDARETPTDAAQGIIKDSPTRPNCAKLGAIASAQKTNQAGELGCGVGSNVAESAPASDQSEERVDLATFLAWHVQARTGTR